MLKSKNILLLSICSFATAAIFLILASETVYPLIETLVWGENWYSFANVYRATEIYVLIRIFNVHISLARVCRNAYNQLKININLLHRFFSM